MRDQRHPQSGRDRAEQPAGDRADAPDAVEGVEDGTAVEPLHAQPVRVLRDVHDRVQRADHQQRRGETEPVGCHRHRPHRDAEQQEAVGGDPAGAEPADQRRGEQAEQQGTHRQRRQCRAEGRVAQPQLRLHLRQPRHQAGVEDGVEEEAGGDGGAGVAQARGVDGRGGNGQGVIQGVSGSAGEPVEDGVHRVGRPAGPPGVDGLRAR